MLVRARWASFVLDCRSYRGADTGGAHNTDHALVRASGRLRLKANRQCQRPLRIDATKIRTAAAGNGFRFQLQYRFCYSQKSLQSPDWSQNGKR